MKPMKLVDKIGIAVLFLGILSIFWLIRDKHLGSLQFVGATLAFGAYMVGLTLLYKTPSPFARSWIWPFSYAGMVIWFEYLTTLKFKWDLGIFLALFAWGVDWSWKRFKAKQG